MKLILLLFLLTNTIGLTGQKTDVGFAKYLYNNEQYLYAAEEFDKLSYFYPHDSSLIRLMFDSYRKAKQHDVLIQKFKSQPYQRLVLKEFIISEMLYGNVNDADSIFKANKNILSTNDIYHLDQSLGLILMDWDRINNENQEFKTIFEEAKKTINKSPVLAASLSSIIPGAGRLYTGEYQDAVISGTIVLGFAVQSYVRYKKKGIKNTGAWIYAGLGVGFYIGNIFGSNKSAKRVNEKKKLKLINKSKIAVTNLYNYPVF